MERKMYNENSFEQNLKKKADAYRMYPSDHVWESIHQQLHTRPAGLKWSVVSIFVLIFTGASLIISRHQNILLPAIASISTEVSMLQPEPQKQVTLRTIQEKSSKTVQQREIVKQIQTTPADLLPKNEIIEHSPIVPERIITEVSTTAEVSIIPVQEKIPGISSRIPEISNVPAYNSSTLHSINEPVTSIASATQSETIPEPSQTDAEMNFEVAVPVHIKTKPKKELQFYITPSASYRVLYVDNKLNIGNLRLNPESVVSHQVATGWEGGVALLKPLTNRLRFRSGLQANYTRYKVNASQSVPEITTVTLTSFTRIQRLTTLRNSNGALPRNLENKTLQISIPVGLEYRLLGNSKLSFNLAGTIQPTYTVNATGYMVTTDYRNYIKAPDLLRRFNMNSGLESFVRFKTGSIDIHAGPQLRYQLFSNTKGKYPIQEHLVDYGFKLGIIKTIK